MVKNMNSINNKLILLIIPAILTACITGENPGPLATEERPVPSFSKINIESIGKVRLHISQESKIIINTNSNVLDDIISSVSNNELSIRLTGKHKDIDKLDFDVYSPSYQRIKLDGVAEIYSNELIQNDVLEIIQSGVGNIILENVDAREMHFNLDEVGKVSAKGTAESIYINHNGVGDLQLFDLAAKHGDIDLSGTGDVEINVSEDLKIKLSGVGSIYYKGSPSMSVNHTGVGKIVQVK